MPLWMLPGSVPASLEEDGVVVLGDSPRGSPREHGGWTWLFVGEMKMRYRMYINTYYGGQHDQIPRVISGKNVGNDSEVRRNYSHRINLRESQSQRTDVQDVCHGDYEYQSSSE